MTFRSLINNPSVETRALRPTTQRRVTPNMDALPKKIERERHETTNKMRTLYYAEKVYRKKGGCIEKVSIDKVKDGASRLYDA